MPASTKHDEQDFFNDTVWSVWTDKRKLGSFFAQPPDFCLSFCATGHCNNFGSSNYCRHRYLFCREWRWF